MFNTDILKYCFHGSGLREDRRAAIILLNLFGYYNIECDYGLDSSTGFYRICKNKECYYISLSLTPFPNIFEISINDYLTVLVGSPIELDWYKNLNEGDTVTIGWCSREIDQYIFGFDIERVLKHIGQSVTISQITKVAFAEGRKNKRYYNDDNRAYKIKELDHYLPSSVFVPKLENLKELKIIKLVSLPINVPNLKVYENHF